MSGCKKRKPSFTSFYKYKTQNKGKITLKINTSAMKMNGVILTPDKVSPVDFGPSMGRRIK